MKKLCFKKYRNNAILCCVLSICVVVVGALIGGFAALSGIFCGVLVGMGAAYYLYAYISYRKRCRDLTPQEGVIANWQLDVYGWHRGGNRARVTVKVDEKEYASPTYFWLDEAQAMVGKKVSYVILEDTLLIYEIWN